MDSESLRNKYNLYYSQLVNKWGSEDFSKVERVVKRVLKKVPTETYNGTVEKCLLDIGCGTGFYTETFRKLGFRAIGIDYSEVVLEKARNNCPKCEFIHMDGFAPDFKIKFNLIFCKGFSGANTRDLGFVAEWVNKYIDLLEKDGVFVFSYSSDFSGIEKENETVNWTQEHISEFSSLVKAERIHYFVFHFFDFLSIIKKKFVKILSGKKKKEYYFLLFQRKENMYGN